MGNSKYHKTLFWSVGFLLLALMLYWAPSFPINIDEFLHGKQAKMVANWYATLGADDSCLQARPDNLRYYGQSVDNLAAAINAVFNIKNEYTTRHFVGALVGFFLLILTGKLTHYITGNYAIATLSMIALFISPRPFGQALGNLKDIPYALGYIWATFGTIKFIKEMPVPTLKTTLFLAGGIAFSNSVRIGGILSFLILGFFVLVWILLNYKQSPINHLISINRKHYTFLILILIVVGYLGDYFFGLMVCKTQF